MADPENLDDVRRLFAVRKNEIIEKYRAEGAGVGKGDRGYEVVVYVAASDLVPRERVTIDGVPLRFEVTGKFSPLRGGESWRKKDPG
jgi:hypothetical protein